MTRATTILALLALTILVPAHAGNPPVDPRPARTSAKDSARTVIPEQARAIARGLESLAKRQEQDGSWGGNPAPIATTALCTLALLAGGNSEKRGRYRKNVRRALDHLLAYVETDPRAGFQRGYIHRPDDDISRLHGHGYATLVLAEAYGGIRRDPALPGRATAYRRKLDLAVRLIERCQEKVTGGWHYEPRPGSGHEGSVTVCQIQALLAAKRVGIRVDPGVIRRARAYIIKSQNGDGGFIYELGGSRDSSTYALTAAAVAALTGTGDRGSSNYKRGLDYLLRHLGSHLRRPAYLFYGNFYAAQAIWQADPRTGYWARYWPGVRRKILEAEARDPRSDQLLGQWNPADVQPGVHALGPDYGTAMACLILQVPCASLPLFMR
jgi:hypothetical protein